MTILSQILPILFCIDCFNYLDFCSFRSIPMHKAFFIIRIYVCLFRSLVSAFSFPIAIQTKRPFIFSFCNKRWRIQLTFRSFIPYNMGYPENRLYLQTGMLHGKSHPSQSLQSYVHRSGFRYDWPMTNTDHRGWLSYEFIFRYLLLYTPYNILSSRCNLIRLSIVFHLQVIRLI